ncbi:MAG: hypothetical protein HC843_13335 [Sphingomonadales bacterium]|nr:hypothetical protein [Sphingomonadales bacterium]
MARLHTPLAVMFSSTPLLQDVPPLQMRIVVALRIAVMAGRHKRPVEPYLAGHLGSTRAAAAFTGLIHIMGDMWPDPFTVHPPCCRQTSYDEMLLLDLVTATLRGEPDQFSGLLSDMLNAKQVRRLQQSLASFVQEVRASSC